MARRTQERTACAAYILRSPHSFINIIFLFSILCILVDMFKKPFKTQQQNLLKSSDKRKLRDNLLRNFPNIKEDELNQVLPIKEDIMMQKISGSHMLLYLVDNNPLFFDLDGRGDFYPTCMYPQSLFTPPFTSNSLFFLSSFSRHSSLPSLLSFF